MLRRLLKTVIEQSAEMQKQQAAQAQSAPVASSGWTLPVLMVEYYPVTANGHIDREVTGDVDGPLDQRRQHVTNSTRQAMQALKDGSCYHQYKNPNAKVSIQYEIVQRMEILEPLPTFHNPKFKEPMTDYNAIMKRINAQYWVEEMGVKEIWVWGYHGGKVHLWESNMSGPYGDISNSDRDATDLPIFKNTYTCYHYNYGRGASEFVENHMHQIEAVLRHIDYDLFWKRFVGDPGEGRCGWSHFPPNGERDYDWKNTKHVMTDIEDWKPDGSGQKQRMNCDRWNGDSLQWFTYWMQNIPGAGNGLDFEGKPLTNWWRFIGDFDNAMRQKQGLYLKARIE